MKRPTLILLPAVILTAIGISQNIIWQVSPLLVGVLVFIAVKYRKYIFCSLLIVCVLITGIGGYFRINKESSFSQYENSTITLNVRLVDYAKLDGNNIKASFKIIDGEHKDEKIYVTVSSSNQAYIDDMRIGDIYEVTGKIRLPEGKKNPGGFDYARHLKISGIYATMYTDQSNFTYVKSSHLPFYFDILLNIRYKIIAAIHENMPKVSASTLCSIMFGTNELDEDILQSFRNAGIAHILAVSGLHVGIIFSAVTYILKRLKIKRKSSFIISMLFLFFYVSLVGFSPSATRAAVMLFIHSFVNYHRKVADGLNNMCFAALIMIMINPLVIYSISFILSFSAVSAIFILLPPVTRKIELLEKGKLEKPLKFIALCLCVQIALIPVNIIYFNSLPLLSLFGNIAAVPFIGLILIFSMICILLSFIPVLSGILFYILDFMIKAITAAGSFIGNISFAQIYVPTISVAFVILFYLIIFASFGYFYLNNKKNRVVFILAVVVSLSCGIINILPDRYTKVAFVDVGFGDCSVITTPENKVIVIDCGNTGCGQYDLLPYLYSRGIYHIDALIITHSDSDHAGGFTELTDKIRIDTLYFNEDGSSLSDKVIEAAEGQNIKVENAYRSDIIQLGSLKLYVLNPAENPIEPLSDNDTSIVIRFKENTGVFLFMADLGNKYTGELSETIIDNTAGIIKLPHHGSYYENVFNIINEKYIQSVIISVGRNGYNLPNTEMIRKLEENNIDFYRTDEGGCITYTIKKDKVTVESYVK